MRGVERRHVQSAHWIGHGAGEVLPAQLGHVVRYAAIRRHPAAAAGGGLRIAGSVGAWKVVDGLVTFVVVAIAAMVMPLPDGLGGLRWLAAADAGGAARRAAGRLARGPRPGRAAAARAPREGRAAASARARPLLARRRDAAAAVGLQLVAICGRVVEPGGPAARLRHARRGGAAGVRPDGAVRRRRDLARQGSASATRRWCRPWWRPTASAPSRRSPSASASRRRRSACRCSAPAVALVLMRLSPIRAARALS